MLIFPRISTLIAQSGFRSITMQIRLFLVIIMMIIALVGMEMKFVIIGLQIKNGI
jgi:hypothetical protein